MSRDEYLHALAQALHFMEEEARSAALSFYAEMLDDRMEDGMEEEAAVAAMESAESIAARLQSEHGGHQTGPDFDPEQMVNGIFEQVRQATEAAMQGAEAALIEANSALHAAAEQMEGACEAMDEEIKKGEDGAYDQHRFTCPAGDIQAVSLTAQDMPIHIYPSQDDQAHLTYYSCDEDPYAVTFQDGLLTLAPLEQGYRKTRRFSLFNAWKIRRHQAMPIIELALPAPTLCDLQAATCNASIQLQGLQALCDTTLTTSNSRITLEQVICKSLEMKTSNSRLSLAQVSSKGFIRGKTSNGRIEGCALHAAGEMHFVTSNGRIHAERCAAQAALSLTTSNGTIEVHTLTGPDITLRTSNGAIQGTLPGPISDWAISSATSNGRNSLPNHSPGEKKLAVHTSNGNIDLEFV